MFKSKQLEKIEKKLEQEIKKREEKRKENLDLIKNSNKKLLKNIDDIILENINNLFIIQTFDGFTVSDTVIDIINLIAIREKIVQIYCNKASCDNQK